MRIRATKPEFWRSKTIADLDWDVRLVLKGLESYVDDNGVGKDDIALIAADVFPRDLSRNPRETLARLSEAISILSDGGLIARYEVDGDDFLYIDRWKSIQRIDKPAKGRFARPDGTYDYNEDVNRESYGKARETVARAPEVLAPVTGEQGNRGTGNSCASSELERDFDEWYSTYPRKRGRGTALRAYKTARRKTDASTLLDALRLQIPALTAKGPDFTPYPSTWLNGERWDDQPDNVHNLRPAIGIDGETVMLPPLPTDDLR